MLRYLRSRIGSSYEVKNYEQKDFVNYTKIATHGFPQKVSCFALSENFGLLAIGTKDGKLQIFEQFVIFSGGIPDDLECQNPICIFCGDNSLILNFDSEIINFEIFEEKGIPRALFVLCQDELVAIDLKDSLWRMFSLPYLYPIHSSPVTCVLAISDISEQILSLFEQISIERRNSSKIFSSNKWPLERLEHEVTTSRIVDEDNFLILTGHDNGNVCIWQATNLNFNLLLVCNTAKEFEGYQSEEEENSQNKEENNNKIKQIPPIRKAGIFDPFSDDHRLCIQKIYFDSKSGTFAVGGQAGQLMTSPANQLLLIDMTSSGDDLENLRASESAIQPRNSQINYEHGFCLYNNIIAQFKPPVPVTAISWNFNMGVLAAGNEFGYAVCSIRERKLLLIKTLMSSLDVLQISNKDSALSRFKSVKKSIRQSFRRKKQPAEQLENGGSIPTQQNRHRQEREITQRKRNPNALDGETPNSLIKILNFETCILSPFNAHPEVYLFVGTQGGAVLIHLIRSDVCGNSERCQLIKEIRLRHHAPIAAIELFQQQPNSRLLVFSEEQIRSFIMPSLKSFTFKYRLTAIEGSRIKKAKTVLIGNETKTLQEKFLAVITNRGEIFFISPTNPKCLHKISFVQPNNTIGIFSSVIAQKGQIFYLNSGGSEFVRLGSHLMSYNNLKCNGVEMSGQKDK
uniref:LLGL domain-containing protein n=1 Tax=Meloidogyne hapla TaxID=6305 RepID=A0A1I8BS85_MELHA